MRLLNSSTIRLESFSEQNIPSYVILSHTWGVDEVTFDDIDKSWAKEMTGYKKILGCCQQAQRDGFEYVWIDTCCIDKKSSSELSESINSMYKFYQDADICYAFLSDVRHHQDQKMYIPTSELERSVWFTRGWTLQELLGPQTVEFYDVCWQFIGTKVSLADRIQEATRIQVEYIKDRRKIPKASIAQRFSWLSDRKTTRTEDMAYCILGIMNVYMPLIYGEGQMAFIRLQEELVKRTTDQTFLCWDTSHILHETFINSTAHSVNTPFCRSPQGFRNGEDIYLDSNTQPHSRSHVVLNHGLQIYLPWIAAYNRDKRKNRKPGHELPGRIIVVLDAVWKKCGRTAPVGIQFSKLEDGRFQRSLMNPLVEITEEEKSRAILDLITITGSATSITFPRVGLPSRLVLGEVCVDDGKYDKLWVVRPEFAYSYEKRRELSAFDYSIHPFNATAQYSILNTESLGLLLEGSSGRNFIALVFWCFQIWLMSRSDVTIDGIESALVLARQSVEFGECGPENITNGTSKYLEDGSILRILTKTKRDPGENCRYCLVSIHIERVRKSSEDNITHKTIWRSTVQAS